MYKVQKVICGCSCHKELKDEGCCDKCGDEHGVKFIKDKKTINLLDKWLKE